MTRHIDGRSAGTRLQRLREFFAANAGEYYTYEDLCLKFDMTRSQADAALCTLRAEGLVESALFHYKAPGS
jgi:DNA-binding IclR family transcriptional regulator